MDPGRPTGVSTGEFPPSRLPHPPCPFPSNGRSTSPVMVRVARHPVAGHGVGITVPRYRYRVVRTFAGLNSCRSGVPGTIRLGSSGGGVPRAPAVFAVQPSGDPGPGVSAQVGGGVLDAGPEVGAPAPQHPVGHCQVNLTVSRPGQRRITDPSPDACSLHLKSVPSSGSCRSQQSAFSQVRDTRPPLDTPKTHNQKPGVNTRGRPQASHPIATTTHAEAGTDPAHRSGPTPSTPVKPR